MGDNGRVTSAWPQYGHHGSLGRGPIRAPSKQAWETELGLGLGEAFQHRLLIPCPTDCFVWGLGSEAPDHTSPIHPKPHESNSPQPQPRPELPKVARWASEGQEPRLNGYAPYWKHSPVPSVWKAERARDFRLYKDSLRDQSAGFLLAPTAHRIHLSGLPGNSVIVLLDYGLTVCSKDSPG